MGRPFCAAIGLSRRVDAGTIRTVPPFGNKRGHVYLWGAERYSVGEERVRVAGYGGRTRMHYRYGFSMDQFDFALVRCTRGRVYTRLSKYIYIYQCITRALARRRGDLLGF